MSDGQAVDALMAGDNSGPAPGVPRQLVVGSWVPVLRVALRLPGLRKDGMGPGHFLESRQARQTTTGP